MCICRVIWGRPQGGHFTNTPMGGYLSPAWAPARAQRLDGPRSPLGSHGVGGRPLRVPPSPLGAEPALPFPTWARQARPEGNMAGTPPHTHHQHPPPAPPRRRPGPASPPPPRYLRGRSGLRGPLAEQAGADPLAAAARPAAAARRLHPRWLRLGYGPPPPQHTHTPSSPSPPPPLPPPGPLPGEGNRGGVGGDGRGGGGAHGLGAGRAAGRVSGGEGGGGAGGRAHGLAVPAAPAPPMGPRTAALRRGGCWEL